MSVNKRMRIALQLPAEELRIRLLELPPHAQAKALALVNFDSLECQPTVWALPDEVWCKIFESIVDSPGAVLAVRSVCTKFRRLLQQLPGSIRFDPRDNRPTNIPVGTFRHLMHHAIMYPVNTRRALTMPAFFGPPRRLDLTPLLSTSIQNVRDLRSAYTTLSPEQFALRADWGGHWAAQVAALVDVHRVKVMAIDRVCMMLRLANALSDAPVETLAFMPVGGGRDRMLPSIFMVNFSETLRQLHLYGALPHEFNALKSLRKLEVLIVGNPARTADLSNVVKLPALKTLSLCRSRRAVPEFKKPTVAFETGIEQCNVASLTLCETGKSIETVAVGQLGVGLCGLLEPFRALCMLDVVGYVKFSRVFFTAVHRTCPALQVLGYHADKPSSKSSLWTSLDTYLCMAILAMSLNLKVLLLPNWCLHYERKQDVADGVEALNLLCGAIDCVVFRRTPTDVCEKWPPWPKSLLARHSRAVLQRGLEVDSPITFSTSFNRYISKN